MNPVSLEDIRQRAQQILPKNVWDFVTDGAYDGITTRRNRAAFDAIALRPRYMVDIWERDLSTTVLGKKISFPVMPASPGQHRAAHPDGEIATARAAHGAGTVMLLSTYSGFTMEEVSRSTPGPKWFQLFHQVNHDVTKMLVHRAEEAGFEAICLTVCIPVPGPRDRQDTQNPYIRPPGVELKNFVGEEANLGLITGTPEANSWFPSGTAPLTWADLKWLRSLTSLPLVIKGIGTHEDAKMCVEAGVDGIIVSNHGGLQIDGTLSSIETLPRIVEAVQGRAEIYLDSGVRRGSDVFRALALGARAVLFGRPIFWGLAVDGEDGVRLVLEVLRQELDTTLAYCGVTQIEDITRDYVSLPGERGWLTNVS